MHVWCIIASFLQCIKSDRMHQIGINASILMCGAKSPRWTPAGKRRSRDTERSKRRSKEWWIASSHASEKDLCTAVGFITVLCQKSAVTWAIRLICVAHNSARSDNCRLQNHPSEERDSESSSSGDEMDWCLACGSGINDAAAIWCLRRKMMP